MMDTTKHNIIEGSTSSTEKCIESSIRVQNQVTITTLGDSKQASIISSVSTKNLSRQQQMLTAFFWNKQAVEDKDK